MYIISIRFLSHSISQQITALQFSSPSHVNLQCIQQSPLKMEVLLFALNLLSVPCPKCLQIRSLRVEVVGTAYAHMQSNLAISFSKEETPLLSLQ